MATLVVSDLHLGARAGVDLLRLEPVREVLCDRLRDNVERLVVLGDGLELREAPIGEAVVAAEPVLADLGRALGPEGEIVLAGGNHDHNLLAGWIDQHLAQDIPMTLEHAIAAAEAGPVAERLAAAVAPARLRLTYPGIWVRDDVYALHGHYLDVHSTVPTIERLAAGGMERLVARLPETGVAPDDYEAVLAPLYAWIHAMAQRSRGGIQQTGSKSSVNAWSALAGEGRRRHPVRAMVLLAGLRGAVAVLNRAGAGPLRAELSGAELRRGSLAGLTEVLRRLEVDADYVLFGHTHRSGPNPRDDEAEWRAPSGTRLMNTGSWVYQRHFLPERPGAGPYWPGVAIRVDASGPPELERLLTEFSHAALAPA